EKFRIRGIKTTIPFHKAVMHNKAFQKGDLSTSFIEKELTQLYYQEPDEEMLAACIAALDYAAEVQEQEGSNVDSSLGKNLDPWVLNKRLKSM
ncbi:MAG TPA: biotin carboxylase, partial [Bacteroidales bacterium]|nr:biotin carboxylase [Bacteroidales bacterium]